MSGTPQELMDRANRHWAAVNAMKEYADAVHSGVLGLPEANDARQEIINRLRGLDNTVITDLLAEITSLEEHLVSAQDAPDAAEMDYSALRGRVASQNEEINRLLCERDRAPQPQYARPILTAGAFVPVGAHAIPLEDEQRRLFEDAGRRAIDVLPHYIAVLHDLSRPQPKTPAQLKAEREEELADKINKLQADGEALGC